MNVYGEDVDLKPVKHFLFRKLKDKQNLIYTTMTQNGRVAVQTKVGCMVTLTHTQPILKILQSK